jgi:dihydroorotase
MSCRCAAAAALLEALLGAPSPASAAEPRYDLLLRGGHLIDPRNEISAIRDVAISEGKVAAVAARIDPRSARTVVSVRGLIVGPGLVDIHSHVYAGTGERGSYAGDNSVYPDGFSFRSCVTTMVDAGSSGWRNFEDLKERVIDRSRTRVLAFINIVGHGMRGGKLEQDLGDMQSRPTAEMALRYPGVIVGVKTAHYKGPQWTPVDRAVQAGALANLPVMVDFGDSRAERPLAELLGSKLRPGDIYTHVHSGLRQEQDATGRVNAALWEARRRGVFLDVGHGAASFAWRIAVPALKEGLIPDSLSTDLHTASMNAGMKDLLNVMSKYLALGLTTEDVVRRATWNPARQVRRQDLGHLSEGAPADLAVLRLEKGRFGFVDSTGTRFMGRRRLGCELTVREGRVVFDLNGRSRPAWTGARHSRVR